MAAVETTPRQQPQAREPAPRSWREFLGQSVSMPLSLAVTGGVLAFLLWTPFHPDKPSVSTSDSSKDEAAQLADARTILIKADTALARKLGEPVPVKTQVVAAPVLKGTGSVVARL